MTRTSRVRIPLILIAFLFLVTIPAFAIASDKDLLIEHNDIYHYGLNGQSFDAFKGRIKPRQTLSNILKSLSVPSSVIHRISVMSKEVFDLRSIRTGNPYLVLTSTDDRNPQFMIYEKNPVDFVVFKLQEPLDVYEGSKDVTTQTVAASWVIEHSLWDSLRAAGCDFSLIEHLSDVYSWSVNFQHLQPGDSFTVLYERCIAAGTTVGMEGLSATRLTHRGRDYYAFRFRSESGEGYYDEKGQSLKKAFLKAPLRYTRITSRFNPGRLHPILNHQRPHLGTDFAAPEGTPIMAVADGRVIESRYHNELGNHMTIRHNATYSTQYLHLSRFAKGIRPGVEVSQGDVIGYVGSTGTATGPHLELRLWKNGKAVDILKEDLPDSEPLKGPDLDKFLVKAASLKSDLDRLRNLDDGLLQVTSLEELPSEL